MKEPKLLDIENEVDLPNLQSVSTDILRGGQPTEAGFRLLKDYGITTIVNFREEEISIKHEMAITKSLSLDFVSIPLRPFDVPSQASIEQFLAISQDQKNFPLFAHCLHGMDRTGLMIGVYRLKVSDWSFEDTVAEMLKFGFHSAFTNLSDPLRQYAKALGKLE